MELNSPSATDIGDQPQSNSFHSTIGRPIQEQSYSFGRDIIKRRLMSDLELVFKDDTGVTHKSNKFKDSILITGTSTSMLGSTPVLH